MSTWIWGFSGGGACKNQNYFDGVKWVNSHEACLVPEFIELTFLRSSKCFRTGFWQFLSSSVGFPVEEVLKAAFALARPNCFEVAAADDKHCVAVRASTRKKSMPYAKDRARIF